MAEKTREQVIAQSRTVAHLAKQNMIVHEKTAARIRQNTATEMLRAIQRLDEKK